MISIVITSFNEEKTIARAIESFLRQNIKEKYELYVVAPDKKTEEIVKKYRKKYKQVKYSKDPGKGKSYAINLILPKLKGDIIILTDGDVYVSLNSVNEIIDKFKNKGIGCVSGHPISQNSRKNLFGYWSHLLCYAAHKMREKRNIQEKFLECSGYLWAFKNKVIKKFPLDVGEDTIVPIMFYLKGYKIKYAPEAMVFVRYPEKLNEFLKQKRRTAGAHDNIHRHIDPRKIPRMKTFSNEILESYHLFKYPQNIKEFIWTLYLFPFRLYIWLNLLFNSYLRGKKYTDAWKTINGTK